MDPEAANVMPRSEGSPCPELELTGHPTSRPGGFDRERLRERLSRLAECGVFLGTSSWKYPGWRGQVYSHDRYVWRGRFSEARFEFESSRFYPGDLARGRDFTEALDGFLSRLPTGWPYGVEIRNRSFLQPEYLEAMIEEAGVA
jgi:hypothetical protein